MGDQLQCIDYPGIVKDEMRALETLGGLNNISLAFSDKNKKLELRMRPKDVFCRPATCTQQPVSAILLKFLPVLDGKLIYDDIVPQGMNIDWFFKDAPLFLPPSTFSKSEVIQSYFYSPKTHDKGSDLLGQAIVSHKTRKPKTGYSFHVDQIPVSCTLALPNKLPAIPKEILRNLEELFKERPVYSRTAILNLVQRTNFQIKDLLCYVAYYFTTGPWRMLWVRYGYDPRIDPSAAIYQTLDFRVRSEKNKSQVQVKRCNVSQRSDTVTINQEDKKTEAPHIFKPGMIPPARQFMLQYCDIHIPEIQALLESLPPVTEGTKCHEFNGWLPQGFSDKCRNIIHKYVTEEVQRRKEQTAGASLPNDVETFYSGSESETEDEDDDDEDE